MNNFENCISYWFPILKKAGVPVPKTAILRTKIDLTRIVDGKDCDGFDEFIEEYHKAIELVSGNRIGPAFLRTGQGSGKHDWNRCCNYRGGDLRKHVANLVQWSHMVSMISLPHDVWAAREMLPVKPLCHLPGYGDMPLVREMRCFVRHGKVTCYHPYWPIGSIRDGMRRDPELLSHLTEINNASLFNPDEQKQIVELAETVAKAFNEGDHTAWSVDILETNRGFYVTDMALAKQSFHWNGCPNAIRGVR